MAEYVREELSIRVVPHVVIINQHPPELVTPLAHVHHVVAIGVLLYEHGAVPVAGGEGCVIARENLLLIGLEEIRQFSKLIAGDVIRDYGDVKSRFVVSEYLAVTVVDDAALSGDLHRAGLGSLSAPLIVIGSQDLKLPEFEG